ncbi:MAG: chemotaxis protein CheW [Kiritimatiellia bacterium]|nr:chemotaxis protein CheW [Kiritimatiellia bacterium]
MPVKLWQGQKQEMAGIYADYRGQSALGASMGLNLAKQFSGLDWVILAEIDDAEAYAPIQKLGLAILVMGLVISVIIALIAYLIARGIADPIALIARAVQKVGEGDLTRDIADTKSVDEVGILSKSFKQTIISLRNIVAQALSTAERVSSSSQELSSSAQEMNATAEEVASTVQQIAKGAETTAQRVEETSRVMEQMSASVGQVATSAQSAASASAQANQSAQEGGKAATMGYDEITKLTHGMESVLDLLRQGKFSADKNIVDLLFDSFDALEALTNTASSGKGAGNQRDITALAAKLERISAGHKGKTELINKDKTATLHMEESDQLEIAGKEKRAGEEGETYRVVITIAGESEFKRPRAFVAVRTLQNAGKVVHPALLYKQLAAGDFDGRFEFLLITNEPPDLISAKVKAIQDVENVMLQPFKADEASLSPDGPAEQTSVAPGKTKPNDSGESRPEAQMVRVPLNKLDILMDTVGELVINKLRLKNIAKELDDRSLNEALDQMSRLANDLQTEIIDVRLVPMDYIFNRFPRLVRDLAVQEKKEVDFTVAGADIGLDRTILDEINTPLVHLLKNAVAHGIELPEARKKAGKNPVGQVTLSARREKAFVVIELIDDGRGMDAELIKKNAIQTGLISEEEASKLSAEDALLLIALPGFSTSVEVTEASGRGVGMNAVKTTVESFGGFLTIESNPHAGSRFILKLPLSMAIIQALLVGVADETYAIPLVNIIEIAAIKPGIIKMVEHHEVIPYHDEVLPLIRLRARFGFAAENSADAGLAGGAETVKIDQKTPKPLAIVVVEMGRKKAGLVVDRFPEKQEVVIKTLTEPLKNMRGIAGATILANGKVALIVDVNALF